MAGKKERQRKLARERYERQQARRDQRAHRWRLISIIVAACCAVVLLGGAAYLTFGTGESKPAAAATPNPTASPTAAPTPTPTPTPSLAAEPASHCAYTPNGTAARKVGVPPVKPAFKAAKYQATIKTNRGTIVLDLLNHKATCTVNSFIYLAAKNYFNNTPCHRLTTQGYYVLQCGDPSGTGSGGPGYAFNDELTPNDSRLQPCSGSGANAICTYNTGVVAMANSGPNTNGSQFFLVYGNSQFPPAYTVLGHMNAAGLAVVKAIAARGIGTVGMGPGDGAPKDPVTITAVN